LPNGQFAPSKSTQHNTPISTSEFPETVTIVDPRHPLFGETFPLICVEDRADRGLCCLIARDGGHNTYLPLDVTNLSTSTTGLSAIPLSVSAVQQLVATYTRLVEGSPNDRSEAKDDRQAIPHQSQHALAPSDTAATGTNPANTSECMPQAGSAPAAAGEPS
jgi:hypothetical protein